MYNVCIYIERETGRERDGGLSTLFRSCEFNYQQRVLKTFPGSGYLHSENGVVCMSIHID